MFRHVWIKNFRCFAGLHLKDLERVNLIAGKNNTGKTALLEAIRLHCEPGNAGLPNEINKERGIEDPLRGYEEVSSWLFWGRQAGMGAEVSSQDEKGVTRTLTIRLVDAATLREQFPEAQKLLRESLSNGVGQENAPFLISQYTGHNGDATTVGFAHNGRFTWMGTRHVRMAATFIPSGMPATTRDRDFFGKLALDKREAEILPPLKFLEPRLLRLTLVPLAGETVIHGDIGLPRLIPVPFMGEGLRRVLSMLLAIANTRGGVVLIDEIENGLHHSVMREVWQAIAQAARQNDVQVFATTHSWECIRAADEVFAAGEPYDFRLHRLDRINDQPSAVGYTKAMIEAALTTGLEMR